MNKIKEKLSLPVVQITAFALVIFLGIIFIAVTVKKDNEHNTLDMTDPRAVATVTSVTSYSYNEGDTLKELSDITVDFYIENQLYSNISIYQIPFHVDIGDPINIKYDKDYPNVCSVVDDPEPQYSIFTYIFLSAVIIFGIFGFILAIRRSKLIEIQENVLKKNATREEINNVKSGYAGENGKVDIDAAPFDNNIDYNQAYDENKGVMDSYFDPFATYGGYEEEDNSDIG